MSGNSKKNESGLKRLFRLSGPEKIIMFVIVIAAFAIALGSGGGEKTDAVLGEASIKITALDETREISYEDISGAELWDVLPACDISGAAEKGGVVAGTAVSGGESFFLAYSAAGTKVVALGTQDGMVVFNTESDDATEKIYTDLLEKLKK